MTKGKRKKTPTTTNTPYGWVRATRKPKDNSGRPLPSPANQKPVKV